MIWAILIFLAYESAYSCHVFSWIRMSLIAYIFPVPWFLWYELFHVWVYFHFCCLINFTLIFMRTTLNIFYRSPKETRLCDFVLPEGVSSVVPSGVNNLASHHCKCYLLTIVCRIYVLSFWVLINLLVASGFMKTSYRIRSLGYPMPPPLVLECKLFGFYISDVPCSLLYN